ncbi:Uncharacterised protein [Malacoplasma iowae]|uniref:Uncharacterized protein n=1 Tax=Malacoplasma iowae 695 TaxID=1048830 RepID=A0A6P1LGX2_MALIO|nr:hypothetical protein GUU_04434 [Malacoplasma iowae 695]VEU62314.1 Uncharacterised protein [Mycoplasmopsis fermentans]VEU72446.1 Uncharacterised protein [Malacoplasma iowae]
MVLNLIVFLAYSQNLFGMISTTYFPFAMGYQLLSGIALLVTVLACVVTLWFYIINMKNIMDLLELSKKRNFKIYIYFMGYDK